MRTLMMVTAVVYAVGSYSFGGATMAQGSSAGAAKNVVLVHGAFADDSSWSKVVPLLKAKGLRVTTAGNPLTSFADDVANVDRARSQPSEHAKTKVGLVARLDDADSNRTVTAVRLGHH